MPLIPELGIYLLPGRIRDPARALHEAQQAEALGLSTAWLSERYDLKDLGVLLGAIAARTDRIRLGMASLAAGSRKPIISAMMGATLQQTFGNRTVFGVARGLPELMLPHGLERYTPEDFEEYCQILRQLWSGETVKYDGPLGHMPNARLVDPLTAPAPELVLTAWVPGPKGIAMAARTFDGVLLGSELTVEATRNIVGQLRKACEDLNRDPATLKIYMTVITAPGLSEEEELSVVHARVISHLGFAGVGKQIIRANGWDQGAMDAISRKVKGIDQQAHRHQMLDLARELPREWIETGTVVGSPEHCAHRLREYIDAGLDEICLHGVAPDQCHELVQAWHNGATRSTSSTLSEAKGTP